MFRRVKVIMKKKLCIFLTLSVVIISCIFSYATVQENTIKYKDSNVYAYSYIDYLNAPIFCWDKVWARSYLYGLDLYLIADVSYGTSAICKTNKGTEVYNKILLQANSSVSVSPKEVNMTNNSAWVRMQILANGDDGEFTIYGYD